MKKKIALVLAVVLLMVATVGGTLAWLTDKTDTVTNTFTATDIEVTLTETPNYDSNNDGQNDTWKVQMIPGYSYTKDPKVEVSADSVDCYLFVKFEETGVSTTVGNDTFKYLVYTSTLTAENDWTQGDGTDIPANVWYRKVMASDTTRSWSLLADNTVEVNENLTKELMPTTEPKLTFTAYASQLYKNNNATDNKFTAAEAWDNITTK